MKSITTIKSEHVIAFDIETVRVVKNYEDLDEGYKSAWRYKNKQDGVVPSEEDLANLWQKNSALYAEFSKVCAVSLAFLFQGKLYCKEFYGPDEKEILDNLSVSLLNMKKEAYKNGVTYRLLGHSSKFFDTPFLSKRYIINGLDIPDILDVTALKPWEQTNLCTNELWKVGGTGAGSSLQALCNVLKVPVSKVDLVGDEVGEAFYRNEYERIGTYCSYDTVATFNVFRRFKKESIFDFEDVTYIKVGKEKEEEYTLLEKVLDKGQLDPEDNDKILKYCKGKSKEERDAIKQIILSALQKDDSSIDIDEKKLFEKIDKI